MQNFALILIDKCEYRALIHEEVKVSYLVWASTTTETQYTGCPKILHSLKAQTFDKILGRFYIA